MQVEYLPQFLVSLGFSHYTDLLTKRGHDSDDEIPVQAKRKIISKMCKGTFLIIRAPQDLSWHNSFRCNLLDSVSAS